jgi:hypothetical protein
MIERTQVQIDGIAERQLAFKLLDFSDKTTTTKIRIWPDDTTQDVDEEPHSFMSDDYIEIEFEGEEIPTYDEAINGI